MTPAEIKAERKRFEKHYKETNAWMGETITFVLQRRRTGCPPGGKPGYRDIEVNNQWIGWLAYAELENKKPIIAYRDPKDGSIYSPYVAGSLPSSIRKRLIPDRG